LRRVILKTGGRIVRIAYRESVRLLLLAFALVVFLAAAWFVRRALLLIHISAIFAVVLTPFVDRFHRRGVFGWKPSRGAALMVFIGLVVVALALILAFAVPPLASDLRDFSARAPSLIEQLRERVSSIPILRSIDLQRLPSRAVSVSGGVAIGLGNAILDFLTVALLIAYFILDGGRLLRALLSTIPEGPRERLRDTLERAGRRMRGWLVGQSMLMLTIAVSSGITFALLGIPYFYLLAIFGGVANIIPMLGPLVTVSLAALVAATQSGWQVLGVLIYYAVYQQVENAFLTPRIMKAQVELSSAVVIIALLIGGELAGIGGALVAVPTAVLVVELSSEYLVQRDEATRSRDSKT
jgi:predicted PurR-regulated permease PerM